ncbi:TetR/AcrR family transcriptional regulator [Nocardioides sp.]|uniref:TetR/AcrR family transcriptional regulator n=1 Tax=Nocardioides sp. TaxID=35761 RepID=UPI003510DD3D
MTSLRHMDAEQEPPTEPREAYLDAARECVLDLGWRRTTLTEVARRAGVSRMTIYRTWADRPALLADLLTREWTAVVDATAPDAARADGLVDRLVAAVRALRGNELFVRIVELDPEVLLPYLTSRRGRSQQHLIDLLEAAVAAGQAAGEVRAGDPAVIARALVLAGHGFVLSMHTMIDGPGGPVSAAALEAELRLLITRALAP